MALWIQNVTKGDRPDTEPHDYVVRINWEKPLATFQHIRYRGAAECLRAAADAIDKASAGATNQYLDWILANEHLRDWAAG